MEAEQLGEGGGRGSRCVLIQSFKAALISL